MKRLLGALLCAAVGAGAGYHYRIRQERPRVLSCYVEAVDPRFGLTADDVESCLREAILLWEEAAGRRLFSVGSDGMAVALVHDERQSLLEQIRNRSGSLSELRLSYEAQRLRHEVAREALERRQMELAQEVDTHNLRVKALRADMERGQDSPGLLASFRLEVEAQGAALVARQEALQQEFQQLRRDHAALEAVAHAFREDHGELSDLQESLGPACQAAVYQQQEGQRRIQVFLVPERRSLVRILAHELGHALGFGHVPDPAALMHEKTSGGEPSLTAADRALLETLRR